MSLRNGVANSLFTAPDAAQPGIYVWTTATASGFLSQYVGETGQSFAARHREHLQAYSTGMYTIHRASSFQLGKRDPEYRGYLWSERRRAVQEPFSLARRAEFMAELAALLEVVDVFVASLVAEQRIRRRIETAIVRLLLAAGGEEAAFLDEGLSTWNRWPEEGAVRIVSRSENVLRGVPCEFEA